MDEPILSICIPTYNRSSFLKRTIESIAKSKVFINTNKIEIVISDNCSTDNTEEICKELKEKYGNKLIYVKQEKPLFPDLNMFKPIDYAHGKFCKLNNDTLGWKEGILEETVEILETHPDEDVVTFLGNFYKTKDKLTRCYTLDDVIKTMSIWITWVGCFCIKRATYNSMLPPPLRYVETRFPITDIIGRLCQENKSILVYNADQFDVVIPYKKGGAYNVADAFGKNYLWVLEQFLEKHNGISKKMFEQEKDIANIHVNLLYFDYTEFWNFERSGYLKHMLKYYKFDLRFYIRYLKCLYKYYILYHKKRLGLLRLFGHCFRFKINYKREWAKKNKHNNTQLSSQNLMDYIKAGNCTKGTINVIGDEKSNRGKLIIGNYVTISDGVKFYLTPNAAEKNLSSFNNDNIIYNLEDIIIKDDVYIEEDVIIKPGVTIGQGAVIKAGSAITKDIPPYAVVDNGNIIRYRFSQDITDKLICVDFSKIDNNKTNILKRYINAQNIDEVLKELSK